jgi:hypothetical protein
MIKFLTGSCLSGLVRLRRIRDRFERTIGDLTLWMKPPVKAKTFMNSPGQVLSFLLVVAESED